MRTITQAKKVGGITRWATTPLILDEPLLRIALGAVLRGYRKERKEGLREVSAASAISLGYLSEIERGRKESSSEILTQLCAALEVSLAQLLLDTALHISAHVHGEATIPDTIAGIHDTPPAPSPTEK